jgi:hypothetical protein
MRGVLMTVNPNADEAFQTRHRGDWNAKYAIADTLGCQQASVVALPSKSAIIMRLYVDGDNRLVQLPVNPLVTAALGREVRGSALFVGYEPRSGMCRDLTSHEMLQLSRHFELARVLQ